MSNKIICIALVILILVGCSKTVKYKYDQVESQSENWILESGSVSIRDGDDSMIFKIKYNGNVLIDKGESWSCDVLICEDNKASSIDEADVIYSRIDIYTRAIGLGDIKVVKTDKDVIDIQNDYDFDSIYLKIKYTIDKEEQIDTIKLSLRN